MTLSDPEILELNELCSALVDGTMTRPQRDRLNQWLAASSDARAFYVRAMTLSASLHDYASEMQTDAPLRESARIISGPARWWGIGSLAAAAAVVLALWFAFSLYRERGEKIAAASDEEEFVATLSGLTGGTWSNIAPAVGEELRRGQQLELISGLAEITFDSGAQIILEGPAVLDLTSAWDAVLHRGSLKANVPPEAIGFRVSNADVEVTDLGTEFSMVAGADGGTEVFVLKGEVQAAARSEAKPITLRETQARRFDRASNSEVRDREQKLKRLATKAKFNQLARPARYVHWGFDESDGPLIRAEASGLPAPQFDARIVTTGDGAPARTEGRREHALALDGRSFVTSNVPSLANKDGASVAFWVRVPEDAALSEAGAMVAWHYAATDGAVARISWNRNPAQGALGALRTDTEHGYLVGTTPLRDGRWHHIAVVSGPAGRPRHYVDGRLEAVTAKRLKRSRSDRPEKRARLADFAANTLWIGRSPVAAQEDGGRFRGTIDELFLADRALTPPEIRHLLRENRPATPVTIAALE